MFLSKSWPLKIRQVEFFACEGCSFDDYSQRYPCIIFCYASSNIVVVCCRISCWCRRFVFGRDALVLDPRERVCRLFLCRGEKSHWSLEPFNLKRVRLSKKSSTCRIFLKAGVPLSKLVFHSLYPGLLSSWTFWSHWKVRHGELSVEFMSRVVKGGHNIDELFLYTLPYSEIFCRMI